MLSLFEFERRSGILNLHRDDEAASLYVADGRVVRALGPDAEPGSMAMIMRLLDWKRGRFEWSPCEVVAGDDLGLQTQQLLLEHARVRDEQSAGPRRATSIGLTVELPR